MASQMRCHMRLDRPTVDGPLVWTIVYGWKPIGTTWAIVLGLRIFCHLAWRRSVSSCAGTRSDGPEDGFPGAWTAAKGDYLR